MNQRAVSRARHRKLKDITLLDAIVRATRERPMADGRTVRFEDLVPQSRGAAA